MSKRTQTEVLVVGAGPVGLLTALGLRKEGIEVRLIDRGYWTSKESYGLALHPATVGLLDQLGIAQPLIEEGLKLSRLDLHHAGKIVYTHKFDKEDREPDYLLVASQQRLEMQLVEALTAEGVSIGWNQELLEIETTNQGAEAVVAHLGEVATGYGVSDMARVEQGREVIQAQYVIGADGFSSTVRQRLGIKTRRYHPPVTYAVFEVEAASPPPDAMTVFLTEAGTCILWPMPGGACRWTFELPAADAQDLTQARLEELMARHAPSHQTKVKQLRWAASVSFAQSLTDRLHEGVAFLAGDAVHQTLPFAVQSLNAGMQEGFRLAKALDWGNGARRPQLLQEYEDGILSEWEAILSLNPFMPHTSGLPPALRNRLPHLLASIPAWGEELRHEGGRMLQALGGKAPTG